MVYIIVCVVFVFLFTIFEKIASRTNAKGEKVKKKIKNSVSEDFEEIALFLATEDMKSSKEKKTGKCDGDCANCPPHYGYRHGRWYYGRNHVEGCERGGNSCSGGRD